ncbi:Holliday junction resolvase RecU [Paratissierella segnis]|uniref:Holliday junction resolvase RecU n=1 Tax=Paratissierella segnis TaxID=2763679 RepID=A0A926ET83_9FIRM|nr:Holliday junction resolvase RecU [Paratissierella segnis]MBC8589353.1 Holliday junction resolvase RecU [Paratissierella segnis]
MSYHKGDAFEEIINISNKTYKRKGIALVQKIATPMKPIRRGKQIVSAYYEEKSTLDYIGLYNGTPIAFDAKETKEENRFPLSNVADHQIDFMGEWDKYGGITFLLVNFVKLDKTFRLEWEILNKYWEQYKNNKGKRGFGSIPIGEFENSCKRLKSKDGIMLDYLEGIK